MNQQFINLKGLPYIRPIPKVTAVAETDVSIKCPAAGYPLMDVVWNKGPLQLNHFFIRSLVFHKSIH
jgi:hypothetical protein